MLVKSADTLPEMVLPIALDIVAAGKIACIRGNAIQITKSSNKLS